MIKLNIIGDSISLGYGLSDSDLSYSQLLNKTGLYDIDIYAKCGATLTEMLQEVITETIKPGISIVYLGNNGVIDKNILVRFIDLLHEHKNDIIICTLINKNDNNSSIYNVCRSMNIKICDLANQILKYETQLFEDKIHPNKFGHNEIFKCISNSISQISQTYYG